MKDKYPTTRGLLIVILSLLTSIFVIKNYRTYLYNEKIRKNLKLSLVNGSYIEYGDKINPLDLVEEVTYGEISKMPTNIDTTKVGPTRLTYQLTKEDVSKEISLLVEVKDTKKPVIKIEKEIVTIGIGEVYDFKNNVLSVADEVDGELVYNKGELTNGTYIIKSNLNNKMPGTYQVNVRALDKNNNLEVKSFDIKVINKSKTIFKNNIVTIYTGNNYNINNNILKVIDSSNNILSIINKGNGYYRVSSNLNINKSGSYKVNVEIFDKYNNKAVFSYSIVVKEKPIVRVVNHSVNVDSNMLINNAKKYLGYKYVYGGNSPSTGFDCSGFIQYVFSISGVYIGRTTKDQLYAGNSVSRNEMKPGDILVWSDRRDGSPTHTAIYIGNNQMIHAANQKLGVEIRQINNWNGRIISIRRV